MPAQLNADVMGPTNMAQAGDLQPKLQVPRCVWQFCSTAKYRYECTTAKVLTYPGTELYLPGRCRGSTKY